MFFQITANLAEKKSDV